MNRENQNIEWKESWRDEYLKWICGFANAQGGKIYIGKTDKGEIIDVKDAPKLLEDIPNKVRDVLGILVNVNLLTEGDCHYIEIEIDAYPSPISYKGQYHYRSGSTKQELKGAALDKFLLQKQGKRWDGVPTPYVTVKDLAKTAFQYFRKNAIQSNRLDHSILKHSDSELLKKLHLTEGNYLKRAAILLFHPDPEVYVTGAYIKIGYFRTDTELLYQDEIHGYLFEQVEKTMDLLLTKYLKAYISYQGLHRKETYPMPSSALREALLNAIAHKDYSGNTPIQIKVYEDKLLLWNQGQLPENWTVADLLQTHTSVPYNPAIANTFFRAGLIEAWGSGTLRIMTDCEAANAPIPTFQYHLSGFGVEFSFKMSEENKGVSEKNESMSEENKGVSEKNESMSEENKGVSEKNESMSEKNKGVSEKNESMSEKNKGVSEKNKSMSEKSEDVFEKKIAILAFMKENPQITARQMAIQLSISSKTVERFIKQLKEMHQIRRKRGTKGGEWELISE